jgi:hypothetical protein
MNAVNSDRINAALDVRVGPGSDCNWKYSRTSDLMGPDSSLFVPIAGLPSSGLAYQSSIEATTAKLEMNP